MINHKGCAKEGTSGVNLCDGSEAGYSSWWDKTNEFQIDCPGCLAKMKIIPPSAYGEGPWHWVDYNKITFKEISFIETITI